MIHFGAGFSFVQCMAFSVICSHIFLASLKQCKWVGCDRLLQYFITDQIYMFSPEEETERNLLPVNSSQQEFCITAEGDMLQAGDSWKANACTSCTCNNGTIQCFSQRCPAASCRVPVLLKGQCCPHCLGTFLGGCREKLRKKKGAFCARKLSLTSLSKLCFLVTF